MLPDHLLPPLLSVRELVKLYGLQARSQLGQNFLFDSNVTGMNEEETRRPRNATMKLILTPQRRSHRPMHSVCGRVGRRRSWSWTWFSDKVIAT